MIKSNLILEGRNISSLWQQLSLGVSKPAVWLELAKAYAHSGLPWQTGYAIRQAQRLGENLASQAPILETVNWQDNVDTVLGQESLPLVSVLIERFNHHLSRHTGDWLSWLYLARLYEMLSSDNTASKQAVSQSKNALNQAQKFEPVPGESLHWLGVWRFNAGNAQGAVNALIQLLDIRPVRCGSMMYLGEALLQVGNIDIAEKAFARASLSNNPSFLLTLSSRVYAHDYREEALKVLQKAITLDANNVLILLALAKIQFELQELENCSETVHQVLLIQPDNQMAHCLNTALHSKHAEQTKTGQNE